MEVRILSVFLLLSSSLLFSTVVCVPNHHNHHNDFPWQNILSSLGIVVENQTGVISDTEPGGDLPASIKEHYMSDSTVEILKSETKNGTKNPEVVQNSTYNDIKSSNSSSGHLGLKIGIPIVSILFFVLFWYFICKCCFACCQKEAPGVVVMQSNTIQNQQPAPVAPQIILQQPIIQQAPPTYNTQQRWGPAPSQAPPQWSQPPQGPPQWSQPPQGPPQWSQPPQAPPQWVPQPMGQQQQYSSNSGYDNAGFNPATAPPPYNTEKH